MKTDLKQMTKDMAFVAEVKKRATQVYPTMSELARERFEREMDWIRIQRLQEGFMQMWEIVEAARTMEATIGTAQRGLENSMVAYCLGLTDKDPLPAQGLPAYPFPDPVLPLNVGVGIGLEHRNRVVAAAEAKHGKSMMRAGLPILKLNGIVLEFFKC